MKEAIRNLFVPTEKNHNIPQLLHPAAFAVYAVLAIGFIYAPTYVKKLQLADLSSGYRSYSLIEMINTSRKIAGLTPLVESETLDKVALDKAKDIFENQYFAHTSPENKTPWDFLRARSYTYQAAGENLAINFLTPEEAHEGLMSSPTHRANILSGLYSEVGVAVYQGIYQNQPSVVVVEYFGKPRATPIPTTSQTPAKTTTKTTVPKATPAVKSAATTTQIEEPQNALSPAPTTMPTTSTPATPIARQNTSVQKAVLAMETGKVPLVPIVCILLILGISLATAFLIIRTGMRANITVIARSMVILALLGIAAFSGGSPVETITPAAISVLN